MSEKHSIREFKPDSSPPRVEIPISELHKLKTFKPDSPPKLVVNTEVYYRDTKGSIAASEKRSFVRELNSKDTPFTRTMTVGKNWVELSTAWVNDIGYFFLRNNGGPAFNVNPTPEQAEEARARIIEVGYALSIPERKSDGSLTDKQYDSEVKTMWDKRQAKPEYIALWIVDPGEVLQGRPVNQHKMYLRCQNSETSITLFIFPS